MGDVLEKMGDQVSDCFFWFYILLSADMAIFTVHFCIAVEAIGFFAFFKMAQVQLILLKIIKFGGIRLPGMV